MTDRQEEYLRFSAGDIEAHERRKSKLFWRRFWNFYFFSSSALGTGIILAWLVTFSQGLF
jgi:hypothetical protein